MDDTLHPEVFLADQLLSEWARDIRETPVIAWTVEGLCLTAQSGSVGPAHSPARTAPGVSALAG